MDEMKAERAAIDDMSLLYSGSGSNSGTNSGTGGSGSLSEREKACVGLKYGDKCTWESTTHGPQNGICIYNKWVLPGGSLFCAKKDYLHDAEKS